MVVNTYTLPVCTWHRQDAKNAIQQTVGVATFCNACVAKCGEFCNDYGAPRGSILVAKSGTFCNGAVAKWTARNALYNVVTTGLVAVAVRNGIRCLSSSVRKG